MDAEALLSWYQREKRDLPWRRTHDPYAILVSEIMLQQTRVEAVIPYYLRFLARFPDCQTLAGAELEEVHRYWAGLGYYRRAENLQKAAREVAKLGSFPCRASELLQLPGLGEYTAAAVASIAFGETAVALDGNALRVLGRLYGMAEVHTRKVQQELRQRTLPTIPQGQAGDFTQSLIELGARVCLPARPRCLMCPLADACQARAQGRIAEIPAPREKRARESVGLVALRIWNGLEVWLEKRSDGPFLKGLWVPPWGQEEIIAQYQARFPGTTPVRAGEVRHSITFRDLTIQVWEWSTELRTGEGWQALDSALPRFTSKVLGLPRTSGFDDFDTVHDLAAQQAAVSAKPIQNSAK